MSLLTPTPPPYDALALGIAMMLALHWFITSNVPMGGPIEWNVMVVYGGFALFWLLPDVSLTDLGSVPLAVLLAFALIAIPIAGNVFPSRISFLPRDALLRGQLGLRRVALSRRQPQETPAADHERAVPILIPNAVECLEEYEYIDGEIIAGLVLGWNFGDGHLHREPLLRAIQDQCGFEEGELRCIFVEAQPMGGASMGYRIMDAKTGLLEEGEIDVASLRARQPWASG